MSEPGSVTPAAEELPISYDQGGGPDAKIKYLSGKEDTLKRKKENSNKRLLFDDQLKHLPQMKQKRECKSLIVCNISNYRYSLA